MRRLLTRASLGLLVALLALVGADLACVAWEYAAYGARWAEGGPVGLYAPGPGRPQLRPGAHLPGLRHEVRINSMGFRGPELLPEKPENGLRVWFAGGSTTFDIYARDDASTWPAVAGRVLQEALPARHVEVVNAGIPGEVLEGSADDFERWQPEVRADVIVAYHGPNDLRGSMEAPAGPPPHTWRKFEEFALFRTLARGMVPFQPIPATAAGRRFAEHEMYRVRERIERFLDRVAPLGAAPILATHALQWDPEADPERTRRQMVDACALLQQDPPGVADTFARYNELVRAVASERGLAVAEVAPAIPPDEENWGDSTHFRRAGSEIAGRVVAGAILAAPEGRR